MKKTILTIIALLSIVGSQAKGKVVVWEKPTTENGNVYGDGFFNIAIDMNRVDLISIAHTLLVCNPTLIPICTRYESYVKSFRYRLHIEFISSLYRIHIEFTIEEQ